MTRSLRCPWIIVSPLAALLSMPARLRRETDLLGEIIRSLTERWEQQRRERFAGSALN